MDGRLSFFMIVYFNEFDERALIKTDNTIFEIIVLIASARTWSEGNGK